MSDLESLQFEMRRLDQVFGYDESKHFPVITCRQFGERGFVAIHQSNARYLVVAWGSPVTRGGMIVLEWKESCADMPQAMSMYMAACARYEAINDR